MVEESRTIMLENMFALWEQCGRLIDNTYIRIGILIISMDHVSIV